MVKPTVFAPGSNTPSSHVTSSFNLSKTLPSVNSYTSFVFPLYFICIIISPFLSQLCLVSISWCSIKQSFYFFLFLVFIVHYIFQHFYTLYILLYTCIYALDFLHAYY